MKTNSRQSDEHSLDHLNKHQRAICSLLELSISTPEVQAIAELSVPMSKVPALFRAAIKEQKATRRNPYREETAILETALALIEHAKGENRTPEQDEFYSALEFDRKGPQVFRVKYVPENVTVN
jgi:hypothetical protein